MDLSISLVGLASVVLLSACGPQGGTDVGNGATEFDVEGYEQSETPQSTQQSLSLGSGVELAHVYMALERVRLQPGSDCENENDDEQVDDLGPFVADLVDGGVIGGRRVFDVTPGPFCELRIDYHKISPNEAPAGTPPELGDNSVVVLGTRADGVPFKVESDMTETLRIRATDGSFNLSDSTNRLLMAYELSAWIDALDLGALTPTGGEIVIDDTSGNVLSAFEDAVESSARLFRDENGDGQLNPSEHAAGKELGEADSGS